MSSPLLSLSPELTREIMKHLFGYMHTINISHGFEREYTMGSILDEDKPEVERLNPAVLRVCSKLRASGMEIRQIRVLLDEELSETIRWIRFWKSRAFRDGFPLLQSVEVETPYAPMAGKRKYWFEVRLDIACEVLGRTTPPKCKIFRKYAQSLYGF
ncbi:hypothetical protein MMC32_004490 [Xylographa parallela]|nr:hypothetical protein [Xylographa parallela]